MIISAEIGSPVDRIAKCPWRRWVGYLLLAVLAACSAEMRPPQVETPRPVAVEPPKPAVAAPKASATRTPRVVVVGASVSAGYVELRLASRERDQTLSLVAACRSLWSRDAVDLRSYADAAVFMAPRVKAAEQVRRALRAEPDLVLAVDFMFWFGYGSRGLRPSAEVSLAELRLARQAEAFELLEQIECPVVVGDYPDMKGADPRILSTAQIPAPEVLAQLNQRLRAWASERPNIQVFPLSAWVSKVKAERANIEWQGRGLPLSSELLLQSDRLHATRLGMALLVYRLLPTVRDALPPEHALLAELPGIDGILDRLGADVELPVK